MTVPAAQADLRHAFLGGATGLLASGLVWVAAAIVTIAVDPRRGVLALLLGGMMIHPLAMLFSRLAGRPGAPAKDNPLAPLALESTAILLLGILLALALAQFRLDLFFPAMLLVIGGRYLTFQTLYGLRTYWICGGVLAALGFLSALLHLPVAATAAAGGVIELVFAGLVYRQARA